MTFVQTGFDDQFFICFFQQPTQDAIHTMFGGFADCCVENEIAIICVLGRCVGMACLKRASLFIPSNLGVPVMADAGMQGALTAVFQSHGSAKLSLLGNSFCILVQPLQDLE